MEGVQKYIPDPSVAAGQSARIPTTLIASREMAWVSMVPAGLERLLTPQELADFVPYLKSLR